MDTECSGHHLVSAVDVSDIVSVGEISMLHAAYYEVIPERDESCWYAIASASMFMWSTAGYIDEYGLDELRFELHVMVLIEVACPEWADLAAAIWAAVNLVCYCSGGFICEAASMTGRGVASCTDSELVGRLDLEREVDYGHMGILSNDDPLSWALEVVDGLDAAV